MEAIESDYVARVPHPVFVLLYGQKNITEDISPYVLSLNYTDHLTEKSDELEVTVSDSDHRWINAWYPKQGDTLTLKIGYEGDPLLPCGTFEIDEIEFSDPPSVVSIKAFATAIKTPLRTRNSRGFENVRLASIVNRIAKKNGLTLQGKIADIKLDRITQYQEEDLAFLSRLAAEYGHAFKVTGKTLVFTDMSALHQEKTVFTISPKDVAAIRMRDTIKGAQKAAKGKYHDAKKKEIVSYTLAAEGENASGDTLKIASRGTKSAVMAKTKAALNKKHSAKLSGSLEIEGNPRAVAGVRFVLQEYGVLSGAYLIDSARHTIEGTAGWKTSIEFKRGEIKKGKGADKKKLAVYGVKEDGQVGVVGSSDKSTKNTKGRK